MNMCTMSAIIFVAFMIAIVGSKWVDASNNKAMAEAGLVQCVTLNNSIIFWAKECPSIK